MVLGYLVYKRGMQLKSAYDLVDERNGGISPNGAFLHQLRELECRTYNLRQSTLPVANRKAQQW